MIQKELKGFTGDKFKFSGPLNFSGSLNTMWVGFDDGYFSLNGLVSIKNKQTSFSVKLLFEDYEDYTKISFSSLKVGKLPLPKAIFSRSLSYADKKNYLSLEYGYGTYDLKDLHLTITDEHLNDLIEDQFGIDIVNFKSILFDNQKVVLNYEFVGDAGKAVNALVNELSDLLKSHETFSNNFDTKLNGTSLTEEEAANVTENVKNVLSQLETKLTDDGAITDLTAVDQAVIDGMVDSINEMDETKKQEVANAFVNTIIDHIAASDNPENKQAIADYLGVPVEDLGNGNVSNETLEEMMLYFLNGGL
jgi:hypothetical protein